jgi:hypothetical protein
MARFTVETSDMNRWWSFGITESWVKFSGAIPYAKALKLASCASDWELDAFIT